MGNTPNIRFKGFTDDWEQRKLGEMGITLQDVWKNQDIVAGERFYLQNVCRIRK